MLGFIPSEHDKNVKDSRTKTKQQPWEWGWLWSEIGAGLEKGVKVLKTQKELPVQGNGNWKEMKVCMMRLKLVLWYKKGGIMMGVK